MRSCDPRAGESPPPGQDGAIPRRLAEISATSATEKNKTMKPLSNQSSVCPRSRTTSRHAKPRATRTIPRPSMRSLPPFRQFDFTRELGRVGNEPVRQVSGQNSDGNFDKEDPAPTPVSVITPPSGGRSRGSHDWPCCREQRPQAALGRERIRYFARGTSPRF